MCVLYLERGRGRVQCCPRDFVRKVAFRTDILDGENCGNVQALTRTDDTLLGVAVNYHRASWADVLQVERLVAAAVVVVVLPDTHVRMEEGGYLGDKVVDVKGLKGAKERRWRKWRIKRM